MTGNLNVLIKRIQLRRSTAEKWAEKNPILASGEPAFAVDTNDLRIGDGVTHYNDLPSIGLTADVQALIDNTDDILLVSNPVNRAMPFIRQTGSTYEPRPSTTDFPSVFWFGQIDATEHPNFVEYNESTGQGDIWIEIQL